MRLRLVGVLLATAAVLALGACGSDKKSTTATAGTTASDTPSTTNGSGSSRTGTGLGAFTSAQCTKTATAMAKAAAALPQAYSGTARDLEDSVDELKAFVAAAPKEIRADVQILADGYAQVITILADAKYDPSSGKPPSEETIQKLTAAGETLDESEFKEASERVTTWFTEKCGR